MLPPSPPPPFSHLCLLHFLYPPPNCNALKEYTVVKAIKAILFITSQNKVLTG